MLKRFRYSLLLISCLLFFSFQNCGSNVLDDPSEGGFTLRSLASSEGTPCLRLAAGFEQLSPTEFEFTPEDSDQTLRVRCIDQNGGRSVQLEILSDSLNLDLNQLFKEPTQNLTINLVIADGVTIGSLQVTKPALTTGRLPSASELHLINHGRIQGAGGMGGHGGACGVPSLPGQDGGVALEVLVTSQIENRGGKILGGGGGGGGGGDTCQANGSTLACGGGGGGGGGAGTIPGFAGAMTLPSGDCDIGAGNFPGENGLADVGGRSLGQLGGKGGDPGEAGEAGRSFSGTSTATGQPGGKAGAAVKALGTQLNLLTNQVGIQGPVLR